MKTDKVNKRIVYLDVLRILACFLVIVNHTNSQIFQNIKPSTTWFVSITYFFICKVAVPIFVMVSGVVLLNKENSYKEIFEKLFRILIVLVLFASVYYIDNVITNGTSFSIKKFILNIYRGNITNAYWYLYLYIGILFMLPILQRLNTVMKKKDYIYFFVISLLISLMPIITHYKKSLQYSSNINLSLFNIYICLLFMGYFIENYLNITRRITICAFLLFVLTTFFNVIITYFEYTSNLSKGYLFFSDRTLINIVIPSICIFIIVKYLCSSVTLNEKVQNILSEVGKCTFGIYLISDLTIKKLKFVYTGLILIFN